MDRKQYLSMCQRCAMLKSGMYDVKMDVPDDLKVIHNGFEYYPISYELAFDDKGNPLHKAILHDLGVHSIVKVDLERVEKYV